MFDKSISAPGLGYGIRTFTHTSATQAGYSPNEILVITQTSELRLQWLHMAPGVDTTAWRGWLRKPTTSRKLIIVDEMPPRALARIMRSLHDAPQPVWLINMPLPLPGLRDYQYEVMATLHSSVQYLRINNHLLRAQRPTAAPQPEREWTLRPKTNDTEYPTNPV